MHDEQPAIPSSGRRAWVAWALLVGGALALRAGFSGARLVPEGDELHYVEILHRFMSGRFLGGIDGYWSYAYPLLAWPLGLLTGDPERGLRLLSMLAGAATVLPAALVARQLRGAQAALFTGLLVALHPLLIEFSTGAFTESLYALLLSLVLLAAIGLRRRPGPGLAAAAGGLAALAWLVRPEAAVVVAILIVFILASVAGSRGRRLAAAGIVLGVVLVAAALHILLVHGATGRWTTGSKAAVNISSPAIWEDSLERERFVYSLDETGTRRRIDVHAERGVVAAVRERGIVAVAAHWLRNLARAGDALPPLLVSPLLLLLVPLGILGRPWRTERRPDEWLLVALGAAPIILYAAFRIQVRYLVPVLPLLLVWGGDGCALLAERLRGAAPRRPWIAAAALFVVFLSLVPYGGTKYRTTLAAQRTWYRTVGERIGHEFPGAILMAPPGCPVSVYAGEPVASFVPWTDPAGLRRFARAEGFTHLVAGEQWLRDRRPTLAALLAGDAAGIRLLRRFETPGGDMLLFRFE